MGQTAESLAKKHGTVEVVVLHNAVAYRDPEDMATDPREYAFRTAYRGDRITIDKDAEKRLTELGSVASPDSEASGFAEAGMRDPSVLGVPPSAARVSEAEATGAIQAVVQDRIGDPGALMKLDLHQMKQVAVAFGVPFADNVDKLELAERIMTTKGAQPDQSLVSTLEERELSPDAQGLAREDADRGSESSSRSSGDDGNGGDDQATDAARELADEQGIDIASLQGSGKGGRVTQSDVVKAIAERDAAAG